MYSRTRFPRKSTKKGSATEIRDVYQCEDEDARDLRQEMIEKFKSLFQRQEVSKSQSVPTKIKFTLCQTYLRPVKVQKIFKKI